MFQRLVHRTLGYLNSLALALALIACLGWLALGLLISLISIPAMVFRHRARRGGKLSPRCLTSQR